jgi:chaperonin GroES
MNIQPMQGRVLVKEIKPDDKAKGGLILPESAKDRSLMKGEVLKLGVPTPDYDCSGIVLGAKVLFVEYAAAEVELDGEKYRFIRYEDVIGTIDVPEAIG